MMSKISLWNQGCASGCAFMMKANGRSKTSLRIIQNSQVVPHDECSRCNKLDFTNCCSNQQNVDKTTSHGGNFDRPRAFRGMEKRTMLIHLPEALRARWLEKSTDVCRVVRNGSGSPQRWAPRWRKQGTIRKSFINPCSHSTT